MLIGVTVLALVLSGCGGSSDPGPSGEVGLTMLAQNIEEEFDVTNTRCHPVRGGDGKHFYCFVDPGGGNEFKLGVAVVAGKEMPVITSCEGAKAKKVRGAFTVCALSPAGD
jgi:hypothetical protein